MPNLVPPVTTVKMAVEYKERLLKIDSNVTYLMTLYLHPSITPEVVREAKKAGIAGIKSYPAGLTTNSESGVTDYEQFYPVFAAMEEEGLILVSSFRLSSRQNASLATRRRLRQRMDPSGLSRPVMTVTCLQSMMRSFYLDRESRTLHWETMTQFRFRLQRSETARVIVIVLSNFDSNFERDEFHALLKDMGVSENAQTVVNPSYPVKN